MVVTINSCRRMMWLRRARVPNLMRDRNVLSQQEREDQECARPGSERRPSHKACVLRSDTARALHHRFDEVRNSHLTGEAF
jgi:hypothetical protein